MNKKIYILLTVFFILFTAFSYIKSTPELSKKGDELVPVVIHFKGKTDNSFIEKYGSSKFQPFFKETNNKLNKENNLLLVIKEKETFKLRSNAKVRSISKNNIDHYTTKKETRHLELFTYSHIEYPHNAWEIIFPISSLFLVVHLIMGIVFSKRNKNKN